VGLYVEDQLGQHFKDLVDFVKKAEQQQKRTAAPEGQPIPGYGPKESAPVLRDFALRWKAAIGGMHQEVGGAACSQMRARLACLMRRVSALASEQVCAVQRLSLQHGCVRYTPRLSTC
jgi:hypothetical protein